MRFVVVIALFLSLIILGNGALQSWKEIDIPAMREASEKKRPAALAERQNFVFTPQVPALIPDLNTGYLFNAQRSITEEEAEEQAPDGSIEDGSSQVNMDTLVYAGSIIVGDLRKGMISFSLKEEKLAPPARLRRGRPVPRRQAPKTAMENATVEEGEDFYGFKVSSVQPEKILFSKNGTNIEKPLYDPNKQRAEPVALNRPARGRGQADPAELNRSARGNVATGAVPQNQRAIMPQPRQSVPGERTGRIIQLIPPQPDTEVAPDVNSTRVGAPIGNPRRRTVQRPRVIQRRRLPVQTR